MLKPHVLFLLAAWLALPLTPLLAAEQDRGAETIIIQTGEDKPNILFEHHAHQERIEDCDACHQHYAREKGAILSAKKAGEFEPKSVMHECRLCHHQRGAGPVKECEDCHSQ
jgi:hypothetical protein